MSKTILAVGMVDSIHFAKWAELASSLVDQILVVPSGPHRHIHPRLRENNKVRINGLLSITSLPLWVASKLLRLVWFDQVRAKVFEHWVKKYAPDVVHIHELQNGGYPLIHSLGKIKTPVVYTPYGSDMAWYSQVPAHAKRISQFLRRVSVLIPECERDERMARSLGFAGFAAPMMPASGYFETSQLNSSDKAKERMVLVKGYGGKWGLAPQLLESLKGRQHVFSDVEIVIYSATRDTRQVARTLSRNGFNIAIYKKFELSPSQLKELMSRATVHVGLSRSDGQPASYVEAAVSRCIPIQTDTACLPLTDLQKQLGLLASPSEIDRVPDQILSALDNRESIVDKLAELFVWSDGLTNKEAALVKLQLAYQPFTL